MDIDEHFEQVVLDDLDALALRHRATGAHRGVGIGALPGESDTRGIVERVLATHDFAELAAQDGVDITRERYSPAGVEAWATRRLCQALTRLEENDQVHVRRPPRDIPGDPIVFVLYSTDPEPRYDTRRGERGLRPQPTITAGVTRIHPERRAPKPRCLRPHLEREPADSHLHVHHVDTRSTHCSYEGTGLEGLCQDDPDPVTIRWRGKPNRAYG